MCTMCGNASPARELVTIRAKGSDGINRASVLKNDNISVAPGQRVHSNCLRDYCHPTTISKNNRRHGNTSSPIYIGNQPAQKRRASLSRPTVIFAATK